MKSLSKRLSSLLAAAVLCGLTGCSRNENSGAASNVSNIEVFVSSASTSSSASSSSSSSSAGSTSGFLPNSSSVSEQRGESAVSEPMEVEMNGQTFSLPCKVKDIKNITIDRGFPFSVRKRDNGMYMSTSLFDCGDVYAGAIYLDGNCAAVEDLSGETVIGIVAGDSRVPVSYRGLTFGLTKDDIIGVLGDPADSSDTYMYYLIEPEGSVTFSMNSEDEVVGIALFPNIR